ncbi:unnamed protein product [Vitrella brassicaformis CCMP3155]|uniref:AB hydrolase-1 domain-containing protein n=2 Tax=Vitrella brassicaformis TaxID=1169539 RepID=A0A0G4EEU7_VITBC|nr:unnamed protein product [Vitrella brassicaformis CCMP3155]|eukprot:CEL93930.1 unnamed protein product [Vitrella brassicaformis CCMP3155]
MLDIPWDMLSSMPCLLSLLILPLALLSSTIAQAASSTKPATRPGIRLFGASSYRRLLSAAGFRPSSRVLGGAWVQAVLMYLQGHATPHRDAIYDGVDAVEDSREGGTVHLHRREPAEGVDCKGDVLILTGACGSSRDGQIYSAVTLLSRLGFRSHVMSPRGVDHPIDSHHRCWASTGDIEAAMQAIVSRTPDNESPIYFIGFSMGGSNVARWLGEMGKRAGQGESAVWRRVKGGVSVSNPIDVGRCVRHIDGAPRASLSKLASRGLTWAYKKCYFSQPRPLYRRQRESSVSLALIPSPLLIALTTSTASLSSSTSTASSSASPPPPPSPLTAGLSPLPDLSLPLLSSWGEDEKRLPSVSEDLVERGMRARTVWECDTLLSCHRFGYERVEDYYRDASCEAHLEHIQVPFLCLMSLDDPVVPASLVWEMARRLKDHPTVVFAVTPTGGHNLFCESWWPVPEKNFAARVIAEWLAGLHETKSRKHSHRYDHETDDLRSPASLVGA